jgi:DMSO reductase family type II enzyme iron-sulfur subunit
MSEVVDRPQRQAAMVINLDKCIGCQACTSACRTHWVTDRPGTDQLYYVWTETKPGEGWPRGWMEMGDKIPDFARDYGGTWEFNWDAVVSSPAGTDYLRPTVKETGEAPTWGPVWEEDQGGGEWPNGYYFYMPRMCNHCSHPTCIDACAEHCEKLGQPIALSKNLDGIVMVDSDVCDACGACVAGCPYKVPLCNHTTGSVEMCDFCSMRVEKDFAPVCAKSCPARAMYFGFLDDSDSYVQKLVNEYRVALPLRPDFGTEPNVYYVPPFVRPNRIAPDGSFAAEKDIPIELLREYFGPEVDQALATLTEHRAIAERGEPSELMEILIIYRFADAFTPFKVEAPETSLSAGTGQTQ